MALILQKIFQAKAYASYLRRAQTKYYVHSPFVYSLAEEVIYDKRNYYAFDEIEALRKQIYRSDTEIKVSDLGAGSNSMGADKRRLSSIVKNAAIPAKFGRLLFRLFLKQRAQKTIELGTSLGIGSLYISKGFGTNDFYTLEGCSNTLDYAKHHFSLLKERKIKTRLGNFDTELPKLLNELGELDAAYIDGNHKYAATMNYFNLCLSYLKENSFLVFDDIYWSEEMAKAWQEIKEHPKVSLSLDFYRMGIVFFKTDQAKEHFTFLY